MGSKQVMVLVFSLAGGVGVLAPLPARGQSARDACALVTQAQVSSAAGTTMAAGERIGTTGCQWSTDAKAKTGRMMITLSIWDEKRFPRSSTPGLTMKTVSGIGDAAVFDTLGDLTSLFVKKGESTLQIRVYGLHDTARQEEIERSIARDALAKW